MPHEYAAGIMHLDYREVSDLLGRAVCSKAAYQWRAPSVDVDASWITNGSAARGEVSPSSVFQTYSLHLKARRGYLINPEARRGYLINRIFA